MKTTLQLFGIGLLFAQFSFAQYAASASGSTTAAGEINGKINHQEAAGAPSGVNCTVGKDLYTNTTNGDLYRCTTTGTPGTWTKETTSANNIKSCVIVIGDPGASSPVLANDNDSPVACSNTWGSDWTITTVGCWADAGTPTITPILTGGSGTSILSGALTCGTASWAGAAANGTVTVHTFSGAGGVTCSSTPCTADVNITTAGGTAKYIVVKIVGTL